MASNRDISSTEKLLDLIRSKAKTTSEEGPSYKPAVPREKPKFFSSFASTFHQSINIGVDIGQQIIQLVKVEEDSPDKYRVLEIRRVPVPAAMVRESYEFSNFLRAELANFIGTARGVRIWNLLSSSQVDVRFIKIPKVTRKQMENAVYWTAKRDLAFEDAETIFDFEVQGDVIEQGVKKTSVMVYITPRKDVESTVKLFADAGYPLSGLTVAPFAIQNLFRAKWMPSYNETLASLYIEREGARIDIYSRGNLILTRDIKTGMNSLVESLLEAFTDRKRSPTGHFRWDEAPADVAMTATQAHKLIMSLDPTAPVLSADDVGRELLEEDVFEMVRPAVDRLVRQVERTFANLGGEKVSRIYVSGAINAYRPFIEYIGEQLGIESGAMDVINASAPFMSELAVPAISSDKATLTTAVGLALSDNSRTPNLLYTYKEKEKAATVGRVNRAIVGSIAAVIVTGLVFFAWQEHMASKKRETISDLNLQLSSLNLMVDTNLILQMASKDREERRLKKEYGERYLGMAVLSELSALTPENIRFLKVKTILGRHDGKGPETPKVPEKGAPAAKQTEAGAKTLDIDGLVLGERSMLEGYLSSYVLKLKGSPLFREATVQRSVVEVLQQNKAEGEVLHFSLSIKLP